MDGQQNRRTFWTTLKLYVSSRWKTFEPIKVKMGMMLWRTASGATRARLESSKQAWWNVCRFSDAIDK